ncbi:MAG: hypothetical protein ACK4GC_15150, partial [Paracoccaceae bacterium]
PVGVASVCVFSSVTPPPQTSTGFESTILAYRCNDIARGARGKKSTVSVDKPEEKVSPQPNFLCFPPISLTCTLFRQKYKALKTIRILSGSL